MEDDCFHSSPRLSFVGRSGFFEFGSFGVGVLDLYFAAVFVCFLFFFVAALRAFIGFAADLWLAGFFVYGFSHRCFPALGARLSFDVRDDFRPVGEFSVCEVE